MPLRPEGKEGFRDDLLIYTTNSAAADIRILASCCECVVRAILDQGVRSVAGLNEATREPANHIGDREHARDLLNGEKKIQAVKREII